MKDNSNVVVSIMGNKEQVEVIQEILSRAFKPQRDPVDVEYSHDPDLVKRYMTINPDDTRPVDLRLSVR